MNKIIEYYKGVEDKIVDIYLFLFLLASLLLSRNTLISSCVLGFNNSFFILLLTTLPLVYIFFRKIYKNKVNLKDGKFVIIFAFAMIFSIILKKDIQLYNLSVLIYIVTALMFSMIVDFNKVIRWYIWIIVILSLYSLVGTYLIKPYIFDVGIEKNIEKIGLLVTNSVGNVFLNLGLVFVFFEKLYIRNFGIFTEPSFFQFYITIAIIFIMFSKRITKKNLVFLIILIITLFSTVSAAGYLVFAIIMILYLFKLVIDKKINKNKIITIVPFALLFVILIYNIPIVSKNIKFVIKKYTIVNASSSSRVGSLIYTTQKFLHSPLIGNDIAPIMQYKESLTNTTIAIGAMYGIIPFILGVYFIWKLSKKCNENIFVTIGIFASILLSFNSHHFLGVSSFWLISVLGFSKTKIMNSIESEGENNENTLDS